MPGVKTHDRIAAISAVALTPLSYIALLAYGDPPQQAALGTTILVAAHLFGSWWLSPDLDIDSAIDNRWGPLFWIWRPYMWAVPHRHRLLSHSGVSALLRLLYLYAITMVLLLIITRLAVFFGIIAERAYTQMFQSWVANLITEHPREVILVALGVVISDALHSLTDYLVTTRSRVLRLFGIRIRRDYRGHDNGRPRRRRG